MEPKLRIIRKKKSEAENAHLDPLMRALKALHSARGHTHRALHTAGAR